MKAENLIRNHIYLDSRKKQLVIFKFLSETTPNYAMVHPQFELDMQSMYGTKCAYLLNVKRNRRRSQQYRKEKFGSNQSEVAKKPRRTKKPKKPFVNSILSLE